METSINKNLLNKLLENNDLTKLNMFEVINFIYDATYIHYSTKFFEEKTMRETVEKRIVDKNIEIDRLTERTATLETLLEQSGIDIPKESESKIEKPKGVLSLY